MRTLVSQQHFNRFATLQHREDASIARPLTYAKPLLPQHPNNILSSIPKQPLHPLHRNHKLEDPPHDPLLRNLHRPVRLGAPEPPILVRKVLDRLQPRLSVPLPRAQQTGIVGAEGAAREGVGESLGVFEGHGGALARLRCHGMGSVADEDHAGKRAGPVGEGRDFEEATGWTRLGLKASTFGNRRMVWDWDRG